MNNNTTSSVPWTCGHCGRPIGGEAIWLGSTPYHPECTESPYNKKGQVIYPEKSFQLNMGDTPRLDETLKLGIEATLEMLRVIDERIDNIERLLTEEK